MVSWRPPTCPGRFFGYHTHMDVTTCGRADLQELDGENLTALRFEGIISTLPLGFAQGAAYSDINGNEVAAGAVRSRSSPYGEYRLTPTADLTDKGFTGRAQNDEVALIYMRARYYVPSIGRFLSADTLVPSPTNPQGYNRFSYVNNNPLLLVDPTGHSCSYPSSEGEAIDCALIEEQILRSTVMVEFYYQLSEGQRCALGSDAICKGQSHATVIDDHTILTHNHYEELGELGQIQSFRLYDVDGNPISHDGIMTVIGYQNTTTGEMLQTLLFEFTAGTFSDQTTAEMASTGSLDFGDAIEMAQINWDGDIGTTHVQWTLALEVRMHKGVQVVVSTGELMGGASGGGLFTRSGRLVANNWANFPSPYWWEWPSNSVYNIAAVSP